MLRTEIASPMIPVRRLPSVPERWYVPPESYLQPIGGSWPDDPTNHLSHYSGGLPASSGVHTMKYKIPAGNRCHLPGQRRCHCRKGLYDADYIDYFLSFQAAGWDVPDWTPYATQSWALNQLYRSTLFGEEFWNCADVTVMPSAGPRQWLLLLLL